MQRRGRVILNNIFSKNNGGKSFIVATCDKVSVGDFLWLAEMFNGRNFGASTFRQLDFLVIAQKNNFNTG
jgi:hypothetical protein